MATEAFLKLGDLQGESASKGFERYIRLLSWDWGLSQAASAHSGSGAGVGAVEIEDLGFRHEIDAASPGLVVACCKGTHFSEGILILRKAGGAPLPYLTIKLRDIIVTSVSHTAGEERPVEDVTLNFAAFEVSYQKQVSSTGAKRGGAITVEYDITQSTSSPPKKTALRKGSNGAEVQQLQRALTERGFPVPQTGYYGSKTEASVHAYQSKHGLYPDGIAGPLTVSTIECTAPVSTASKPGVKPQGLNTVQQRVESNLSDLVKRFGLSMYQTAVATRHQGPAKLQETAPISTPVTGMTMSQAGKQFLFGWEAWRGVSERLHWPGGASGVTLGAGYDMKEREKADIARALKGIGVDAKVAEQVSEAAGLSGTAAKDFTKKHKSLVTLTPRQEWKIMELVLPWYEKRVRQAIRVDLRQHQFDALVSFAYNAGSVYSKIAKHVNAGEHQKAAIALLRASSKNPQLNSRRAAESGLYGRADYGRLAAFTRLASET
jgi:type VI secretion system Hcp family effector